MEDDTSEARVKGVAIGVDSSQRSGASLGHVFLSYVREDSERVDKLQRQLEAAGFNVWRDVKNLWPGDLWKQKLRIAIKENALAFVPCFSEATAARLKSTMFEELTWAAEEYRRRTPDRPWIFPVFFDDVSPPDVDLGADRTLHDLQWTLLYQDWNGQLNRLVQALRRLLPGPGEPELSVRDTVAARNVKADVSTPREAPQPPQQGPISDGAELLDVLRDARAAGTTTDPKTGLGGEVFWYNHMAESLFIPV
jgi:hypothetical protein